MELSSPPNTCANDTKDIRIWNESPDIFVDDNEPEPSNCNGRRIEFKNGNRIRNCINAFVNFTKQVRPYYKSKYPKVPFYEITRRIAKHWTTLSAREKESYIGVTVDPIQGSTVVKSLGSSVSGQRNASAFILPCISDVDSPPSAESGHVTWNVTAEPRLGVPDVDSPPSAESEHVTWNVTAEPRPGVPDVVSPPSAESEHVTWNVKADLGPYAESRHGMENNSSRMRNHDMRGRNYSPQSIHQIQVWKSSGNSQTSQALGRTNNLPTISQTQYFRPLDMCNDRLTSPVPCVKLAGENKPLLSDQTEPDAFTCAQRKVLVCGHSSEKSKDLHAKSMPLLSEYVAKYDRYSGTLSDDIDCLSSRMTSDQCSVISPPTTYITTFSAGQDYSGINVCTGVINKSSDDKTRNLPQSPVYDSKKCTGSAPDVKKHFELNFNNEINRLNLNVTRKRKHKHTERFQRGYKEFTPKRNLHCRRTPNSKYENTKQRKRELAVPKSFCHHPPRYDNVCPELGTNKERLMTGSITFGSGIKMKYRKILPKPSIISQPISMDLNTNLASQSAINRKESTQQSQKAETKEASVTEDRVESGKTACVEQKRCGKMLQMSCQNHEIFSLVDRYKLKPDDLKVSEQAQQTDCRTIAKGREHNPDASYIRKNDKVRVLSNKEPTCKTFALKDGKSRLVSSNKNYDVVFSRWKDWKSSLHEGKGFSAKSATRNLVSVFPLVPKDEEWKKNDTVISSDGCQGDSTDRARKDFIDVENQLISHDGSRLFQTDFHNISLPDNEAISSIGPRLPLLSDDIIAMQKLYQC